MSAFSPRRIVVFPLSIPLRRPIVHGGSLCGFADPIVVGIELDGGKLGFGETLPRADVTGETTESVVRVIEQTLAPAAKAIRTETFPDTLEALESLPWRNVEGSMVPAARAAVELALLDAAMRHFDRRTDDIVQWMGLPGFGAPGSLRAVRYSGILAAPDRHAMMRRLRGLYWYGVRNFKLKVGLDHDREQVLRVAGYLERALRNERATLRLDANGVWTLEEAESWLARVDFLRIAAIEQPLPRGQDRLLPRLRERVRTPIVHDESLVTMEDATRLIELGVADVFNIRVSKCGGLIPSLRIAGFAKREGVEIQVGCILGETSLGSAGGLRLLEVISGVAWAEGCTGAAVLRGDVIRTPLRCGYGGQPPTLDSPGMGVAVELSRLEALCTRHPQVF